MPDTPKSKNGPPAAKNNVLNELLQVQGLYKKAEALYKEQEAQVAEASQGKGQKNFLTTMLQRGTASDKVNSLSMLIQKSPLFCISNLSSLLQLAKKKNKKQSELAVFALRDVFSQTLLSEGRRLNSFQRNPLIQGEPSDSNLVEAFYEHCLRELYRDFVDKVLVEMSKDDLEFYRKISLDVILHLLQNTQELKEILLGILVNKLGDSFKKVQQHSILLLTRLLKSD